MPEKTKQTTQDAIVSRRGFLKGTAGITFIIGASGLVAACGTERQAENLVDFELNVWATISSDGKVTVMAPAAEMGQGSMTALPLIFAEELDADWDDINPVQVSTPKKEFGNPYFGGLLYTGGSRAVADYYTPLRLAGAQARKILMQAAADHWHVPLFELTTEPGAVVHAASERRLDYGEIAAFAKVPEILPEISDTELKNPSDFRLIGHNTPRVDVPLKVNGTAQYAMDVQVPGMVYAAVLHAPVEGESPVTVDDAETLKVSGVLQVVALENAVAIIGETVEATRFGKDVLSVEWTEEVPARGYSSDRNLAANSAAANDLSVKGVPWREEGDTYAALDKAAKVVTAEYRCDHVYHAQMEPLNATALVNEAGDAVELWTGTQSQTLSTIAAAKVLGTTQDKVTLHQMLLGGGYGRRAELKPTYVVEAIQLSKMLKKPVKVIWSREDDLQNGWFRPSTVQLMRAGFDEDGKVIAWNHRMTGPSVLEFYNTFRWGAVNPNDVISMLGSEVSNFDVPNILAEHVLQDRIARLSPWRGVATGYTKFAVESFVDELAESEGEDPVEFRLNRILKTDRTKNVLKAAAKAANWGSKLPEGRAQGVSVVEYHASVAAAVLEISLDKKTGKITVHDAWVAADIGLAVQPLNVEAQIEGALIYGIGQAIKEQVTIEDGMVQQSNFHDYELMRMRDVPNIHVQVIPTDNPPSGIGELALPLTGGAIANAMKALTGKRLRHLPLTRERVLEALNT